MIVAITGAIKNVGDYLIASRSIKLLKKFVDPRVIEINRFSDMKKKLDLINASRGVVLCGGPAYSRDIYPSVYRMVDPLSDIKVPIIPFGLGWVGEPFLSPNDFSFSEKSLDFLRLVHDDVQYSSCRDDVTYGLLKGFGFHNVIMTGCPVWYDLSSLGRLMRFPNPVNSIVYTPPSETSLLSQNKKIMAILRKIFPDAKIICSFHRGILPDRRTSFRHSFSYLKMALDSLALGIRPIDVSYDLRNIDFYKSFDLHVGYRVHAHLDFLSRRNPSLLINEDGRGLGMASTMGLPILNSVDEDLLGCVEDQLLKMKRGDYSALAHIDKYIDGKFLDMKRFLLSVK